MTDVPTITREELKAKLDRGEDVTLVEALAPEQYEKYHLPGAVNLPPGQVREKAPEVLPDRSAEIVVYCANEDCQASPEATKILRDMGYRNAVDYAAGKEDWKEAGLPVEGREATETA